MVILPVRRPIAAAAVGLLLSGVACSAGKERQATAPRPPASTPAMMPAHSMGGVSLRLAGPQAAVQLRDGLEQLLGDHVLLTVELMRDRLGRGPAGRAQAAVDAVQENTDSLASVVRQVFGARAATTFAELWSAHVRQLSAYASALAARDSSGLATTRHDLHQTESDLGRFLSAATGGRLSPEAAQAAIHMHVQMLLDQANAYARADYSNSYALEDQGFAHMVGVADSLGAAIAATRQLPTAILSTPRQRLQSALALLFAEHMGIVVEAMRSAVDRAPDFASVGATLNDNSTRLGAAVGALYGADAENEFLNLWAKHVDALIAYSDATARHDDTARSAALRSLDDFATSMAEFLSTATQQRLPAIQLTGDLTEHDHQLTAQLDAYASGHFDVARQFAAQGYVHMFGLASTLAGAIGDTVAARLPVGGPQTGGGGTARRR